MSRSFSYQDRQTALQKMQNEVFDLAIIGGGITGAGIARDAASRGLRVALIEAKDFAWGTSSRSSKLIHGGIRYLENFEFSLVFEALSERQRLFEMAPHLVHPLKFVIPVYKGGRVPAWKMGLGMMVYDALSLYDAPEMHHFMRKRELQEEMPFLQGEGLQGGFSYYDAYMDDDRLVHETLRSARAFGAEMANYTKAIGAEFSKEGKLTGVQCEDLESKNKFTLRARHFVSSVGPWTDQLGQSLLKEWKRILRPSKGVHLTFAADRFPLQEAVVMAAEKRIVFAIPRHGMVIVGTTDTDYPGDPGQVRVEEDDIRYLMNVVTKYFPGARLQRHDILGCYAGVRPLVDDGAETESKTSREHVIFSDPRGVTFVAGGKYTTYRKMAEQAVQEVLRQWSTEDRARYAHSQTLTPLNPLVTEDLFERAQSAHTDWAAEFQVPETVTAALALRHGHEARDILARTQSVDVFAAHSPEHWLWCAEAIHAVEQTMCLHLTDFYFRRTPLVLTRPDHGAPFASTIAQVMGSQLGWSESQQREEINALQNQLQWEMAAAVSQVDHMQALT